MELVSGRDGKLALLHGGDALELRFAVADFPPVAAGHTRSFFFYSVGWDKDADHNVIDGDRIEPLPVETADANGSPAHGDTRWISRNQVVR